MGTRFVGFDLTEEVERDQPHLVPGRSDQPSPVLRRRACLYARQACRKIGKEACTSPLVQVLAAVGRLSTPINSRHAHLHDVVILLNGQRD